MMMPQQSPFLPFIPMQMAPPVVTMSATANFNKAAKQNVSVKLMELLRKVEVEEFNLLNALMNMNQQVE